MDQFGTEYSLHCLRWNGWIRGIYRQLYMRMVIEILERGGGGNLLFRTPNLQDPSDSLKT